GASAHAQGSQDQGQPQSSRGQAQSSQQGAGTLDKSLQEAAQKLHAANQAEVQSGQAALRSAQSSEVKHYAQQMVTDHQKNDAELQQLAGRLGVPLQGEKFTEKQKDAQDDLKDVQGKTGNEFDRAYMKMMVDDHKKDVKEVEDAAKDARKQRQTELAAFLEKTHGHLQTHLSEAQRVEKSLSDTGMAGRSGSGSTSPSTAGSRSSGTSTGDTARSGGTGATPSTTPGTSTPTEHQGGSGGTGR
ncbi:MAG TPA: DUF4142 domain-containing protein, partial [Anaeromyxobacteraceae bacterium]|nr:DUF4142 domain-containing protein [Anaeromyxobacteraceae bacterium]